MTDYHVHIGQFCETYYSAENVFSALRASGIGEVWFSSTTSCMYFKESKAAQNDENLLVSVPAAIELYQAVRSEISDAKKIARKIGIKAYALYWVVPELHFSSCDSITLKNAMAGNLYDGFKIHPRAQEWALENSKITKLAEEVFDFAQKNEKLILIHCDDDFSPRLFERFIAAYPSVKVQLAHCRPKEDALFMLQNYPNIVCDTAMASKDVVDYMKTAGFGSRIRYGSDFPITHWRKYKMEGKPSKEELMKEALKKNFQQG